MREARRKHIVRCLAGCLVAIATTSMVGCDAFTSVSGTVFDEEHKPVAGALVRLVRLETGKVEDYQTDLDGKFLVSMSHWLPAGRFTLTVSKQGYAVFSQEIQPKMHHVLKVALSRARDK